MEVRLEDTVHLDFITRSPSTGAAADADSTPTCEVFEEDGDTPVLSPTVTKRTSKTGNYRVPVATLIASGFNVYKWYNVVASATVGGVTDKAVVATFFTMPKLRTGTVITDTGNSSTTFKTDLTEGTTDWWTDAFLMFLEGSSLEGQVKKITGFNAATDFITTDAFTGTPTATDPFVVINI